VQTITTKYTSLSLSFLVLQQPRRNVDRTAQEKEEEQRQREVVQQRQQSKVFR